jgi:hypothetical protein
MTDDYTPITTLPSSLQQFIDSDEELCSFLNSRPMFVRALLDTTAQARQLENLGMLHAAAQNEDLPELMERIFRAGRLLQDLASAVAWLLDDPERNETTGTAERARTLVM